MNRYGYGYHGGVYGVRNRHVYGGNGGWAGVAMGIKGNKIAQQEADANAKQANVAQQQLALNAQQLAIAQSQLALNEKQAASSQPVAAQRRPLLSATEEAERAELYRMTENLLQTVSGMLH